MTLRLKVEGIDKLKKNLADALKNGPDAVGAALYREGLRVISVSVRLVPVFSGALRGSAYVTPPQGANFAVEMGYGKLYAVPVHERPEVFHKVGQAFYLREAITATASGRWPRVAADAKKMFQEGRSFGSSFGAEFPTEPRV